MIDFVSTSAADPQTVACARLLSAVIAQAIRDACKPMNSREKREDRNIDGDAQKAIRFLFSPDSVFPLYAQLIGSSAESIRSALINKADEVTSSPKALFKEADRRTLRARLTRSRDFAHPLHPMTKEHSHVC